MTVISRVNKMVCAGVSVLSVLAAIAYIHGISLLVNIGLGLLVTGILVAFFVGVLFGVLYLTQTRVLKSNAIRAWGMIQRNELTTARIVGICITAFTGFSWYFTTFPVEDTRFQNISGDQALFLGTSIAIASFCTASHLRSKTPDLQNKFVPWILFPVVWFAMSTIGIMIATSAS